MVMSHLSRPLQITLSADQVRAFVLSFAPFRLNPAHETTDPVLSEQGLGMSSADMEQPNQSSI